MAAGDFECGAVCNSGIDHSLFIRPWSYLGSLHPTLNRVYTSSDQMKERSKTVLWLIAQTIATIVTVCWCVTLIGVSYYLALGVQTNIIPYYLENLGTALCVIAVGVIIQEVARHVWVKYRGKE